MSYPRIIQKVFHSPWAIHQPMLGSILTVLAGKLAGEQQAIQESLPANASRDAAAIASGGRGRRFRVSRLAADRWGEMIDFEAKALEAGYKAGDGFSINRDAYQAELDKAPEGQTMVIFGSGVLGKHLDSMEEMCAGGLSVDKIQQALGEGRDDAKVASIIVHLDSPGGVVYGIAETAALIREISAQKPIVGFCDSQAASAAYWILAACDALYVTTSADLGSIGVYCAVFDYSGWFAKEGMKVELFKDGAFKAAGFPGTSLTDEQRDHLQAEVMACSGQFKADVRTHRKGIADSTMQGQCYFGQQAVDLKLADAVVSGIEQVVRDLAVNSVD
jgi:signal peptide peptidase SppA